MKSFSDYIKIRESIEEEPINPSANDNDETLNKLIKLSWDKHQPQVEKLFNKLSEIDPEIAMIYNKINKKSSFPQKANNDNRDVEMIRPPVSDTGGDLNGSND